MLVYLSRRVAGAIVVLVLLSFLSFWVMASHIDPLAPLRMQSPYPAERIARITKRAHLEDSIPSRYARWVRGVVTGGDAGHTVVEDTPVWPPVWISLRHTLQLIAATLVVVSVFSIGIGVISAARPGTALDVSLRGVGYLAWSVPVFLLALVFQQVVFRVSGSFGFQPLPASGLPSGHGLAYVGDWFRHMVLPVATLSAAYIGAHSRYVRSAMLESLRAPHAVVARSKGLTERHVLVRHALRNSLIPFVTVLALDFGALFGGSFVVDWIFHLQGLGALWVNAVAGYDPFQIEAVLVVTAAGVVVFSVLSDAALGWLDPRVRLD
jgi:peptide/nickel transport system permease protein